jgi:polyhydroxybutyrate depolymerase
MIPVEQDMSRILAGIVAVVALVVSTGSAERQADAGTMLAPGTREITVDHGGRRRSYLVFVPPGTRAGRPLPLVLAFHGGGGNASGFQAYAGLDRVATREGFIVAYPNGTGPLPRRLLTFNAGRDCCGYARTQNIDDVGFAVAVVEDVARRASIDRRRVYATGHSNGGIMAYRLAAERADLVSAIVPVAGAMNVERFAPSRPVAVMHVHSVDDPRALYGGGEGPPFPGTNQRVNHAPVQHALDRWIAVNGCSTAVRVEGGRRVRGNQSAERLVYEPCSSGASVAHWKIRGAGHGWPGAPASPLERWVGPPVTVLDAAEEIWSFVKEFPRRRDLL